MDDLELYARNADSFEGLWKTVQRFRDDIFIGVRLETCEKVIVKQEKLMKTDNIILDIDTIFTGYDQEVAYKYLALKWRQWNTAFEEQRNIRMEFIRRVEIIMKSEIEKI